MPKHYENINNNKNRKRVNNMKKNILVTFDMQVGDYEHSDKYIFHNKTSDYKYVSKFENYSRMHA